jgi:hypothetical protein
MYREHYTPEPVHVEPHPLAVIGGAIVCAAALYLLTFLTFII